MRPNHIAFLIFFFGSSILTACSSTARVLSIPSSSTETLPAATIVPSPTGLPPTRAPTSTPTAEPTQTPLPARYWVFPPYGAAGVKAWQIDGDLVTELSLPDLANNQYDHSPVTGKLLHSSQFAGKGAGPANLAVSDLWIYDIQAKQDQLVFQDQNIVEAVWAPNGQDFAYLLATPTTYELHWRTASGEDRLLVSDVAPTFRVSPDGKSIAFTRESGYKVGMPGVFIVPVDGGPERKIGSVDRMGMGSIGDLPLWSPDGQYILLPVSSPDTPVRWTLIKTDGSAELPVQPRPDVVDWFNHMDYAFSLWLPDSQHVLGYHIQGQVGPPNGQETFIAAMDLSSGQVTTVKQVDFGSSFPIMWEKPGHIAWMMTDAGDLARLDLDNPTPLPQTCKVNGEQLFVNPYKGYCFSYPQDVTIQAYEYERPLFLGTPLDQSVEPLQSRLWVEVTPLASGADLKAAVEQFIAGQPQGDPAITRQSITLGGEPAELLDNVPGQLFSRVALAVHNDKLYALWFNPIDSSVQSVQPDVERLYQAVTKSFAFLPK